MPENGDDQTTAAENQQQQPPEVQRKKRLSRKEQKARKKQRVGQQEQPEQKVVEVSHTEAQNSNSKSKKAKKKKNKKNKKEKKQNKDKKTSDTTSEIEPEGKPEAPSTTTTISTSNDSIVIEPAAVSPWKPADLQEDVPYIPTPLPDSEASATSTSDSKSNSNSNNKKPKNDKTLGKWFPKARVMKSKPSTTADCTILLFYQYKSPVVWDEKRVEALIAYLQAIFEARPSLGGRLRVSREGMNATLSAGDTADGTLGRTILDHFTRDLQLFDDIFHQTDFKYIPAKADRHFKDLKILPVQELVFYGLQEQHAPLAETGVHLEAKDFHEMLHDTSKETVVIDVRNHYEATLGRFDGQERQAKAAAKNKTADDTESDEQNQVQAITGAKYIDPQMRKSTDWPSFLKKSADDLKGKRVMLYCTGGVRCERASAYLNKIMGDELEGVFQLQGGVESYMQAFPEGGYWTGRNFVFDKREAVSATCPNGDGGVIQKKKKQSVVDDDDIIETKCCLCDKPWDRYVGKRKCDTCGVPVLMCDLCMSSDKDPNGTKSNQSKSKKRKQTGDAKVDDTPSNKKEEDKEDATRKLARCDLCVEQNITVPVEEVEYTENGVKSKSQSDHGKAATSVLKWGGGHSKRKQLKKAAELRPKKVPEDGPPKR